MRWVSTRVLPDPAPATTSSGLPECTTAARCCGLSPSSSASGSVRCLVGSSSGTGSSSGENSVVITQHLRRSLRQLPNAGSNRASHPLSWVFMAHPVFARLYARVRPTLDQQGVAEHRRRLLRDLAGRVLEVGAGDGGNFAHYPPEVTEVVAVE